MFSKTLYVQVRKNEFLVRNIDDARSFRKIADPHFSHPRTLLGNFTAAGMSLKSAVTEALGKGFFVMKPDIVIHPLEQIEGGLSQIEERAFQEIAIVAGASKTLVWVGKTLNDDEVLSKLKAIRGNMLNRMIGPIVIGVIIVMFLLNLLIKIIS
jgi:rod shape-determining protein MreB